jgi:hypothetical protein
MTSTVIDAAGPGLLAEEAAGPLEQRHLQYANYRAVADGSKVTRTHWHIALANGLGWGFDGMDGVNAGEKMHQRQVCGRWPALSRKQRATHRESRDRPRFCPSIFVSSEE